MKSHAGSYKLSGTVQPPKVAETTTKQSPAPLHKHSPGGYTADMPPPNFRRWGRHIVSPRDITFVTDWSVRLFSVDGVGRDARRRDTASCQQQDVNFAVNNARDGNRPAARCDDILKALRDVIRCRRWLHLGYELSTRDVRRAAIYKIYAVL